jgi:hypothetical protein
MRTFILALSMLATTTAANAQNCVTIPLGNGEYVTECERARSGIVLGPNGPFFYAPPRPRPCLTRGLADGTVLTQCN